MGLQAWGTPQQLPVTHLCGARGDRRQPSDQDAPGPGARPEDGQCLPRERDSLAAMRHSRPPRPASPGDQSFVPSGKPLATS